ncbi:hypothetical protein A176_007179 [Myxococcus hansupus]|uniref:Uncharacterized protein n=1 Tax=Pseudomyxococcus hansupus TaxID=1297742 RepID=A0A0H4XPG5_9BACT|nr:hypothetical protein A176_007179 [Myxococcus hansupus]
MHIPLPRAHLGYLVAHRGRGQRLRRCERLCAGAPRQRHQPPCRQQHPHHREAPSRTAHSSPPAPRHSARTGRGSATSSPPPCGSGASPTVSDGRRTVGAIPLTGLLHRAHAPARPTHH